MSTQFILSVITLPPLALRVARWHRANKETV